MSKKIQSVEELYASKKAGAGPLIWVLTVLLLLMSLAVVLLGTPVARYAFAQVPEEQPTILPQVTPTPFEEQPTALPTITPTPEEKEAPLATATPEPEAEEETTPAPTAFLKPYTSPAPTQEASQAPELAEPTEAPVLLQPAASAVPQAEDNEVSSDPQAETQPETSAEPQAETQPDASEEPQASAEPEAASESEQTPAPQEADSQIRIFESIPDVVEAVNPAVVGVVNYQNVAGYAEPMAVGSGSGFVVSEDGYILTNAHVVSDAVRLEVLFDDGSSVPAELVGKDTPSDIALLKIERVGLTVLPMGNSDYIRQGEYVLAIGNPLDSYQLYGTVTFGIISAVAREINIDGYVNTYLQTDAAINLGNSGGPLVNLQGQVVGMNTAKSVVAGYDENGNAVAAEGIGFALPINKVIDIANQILMYGGVPRPGIGLQAITITDTQARMQGLVAGVLVDSVTAGSPAEQAGLQADDIIVKLNGEVLTTVDELVSYCQSCAIGDSMTLTIYRNGQYLDVVLVVGNINDFSN